MGILDLEEQLAFYRKYHSDPVNVAVHMVFVPLILLSTFSLLTNLRAPVSLAELVLPAEYASYFNLGVISAIGYGIFYTLLDPIYGVPSFAALILATMKETDFVLSNKDLANTAAWILFATGWVAQFAAHGIFEKRAPALFDNLVQALVLAPFFVVFEFLSLLGLRTDVIARIDEKIKPELEAFRASQKKTK